MQNTTTITLTQSRDVLAYVPHRLGFTPRQSLVLIGMCRAPQSTLLGLLVRCDLPRAWLDSADDMPARRMVENLLADTSVNCVIAVLYVDEPGTGPPTDFGLAGPWPQAAAAIRTAITAVGLELVDELWVTGERWRSYACSDLDCCPGAGWPITDVESSTVGAELVLAGSSPAENVEALTALPETDATTRDAVRLAVDDAARRRAADGERHRLVPWRRRQLDAWRRAFRAGPDSLDSTRIAQLLVALADSWLRDGVLLDIIGLTAQAGAVLGQQGPDAVPGLRRIAGLGDETPDEKRLARAARLLRRLAASATGSRQAAPLAVLGWIEWCRGQSSTAGLYLDRALIADPGHRLARLMTGFVDNGLLPTWVTRPR